MNTGADRATAGGLRCVCANMNILQWGDRLLTVQMKYARLSFHQPRLLLRGNPKVLPNWCEKHDPSSSWVFLWISSQRNVPGVGKYPNGRATSTDSSRCGGAEALIWVPASWPNLSSKEEPIHEEKKTHFGSLYPWSRSFGHYPNLATIDKGKNSCLFRI